MKVLHPKGSGRAQRISPLAMGLVLAALCLPACSQQSSSTPPIAPGSADPGASVSGDQVALDRVVAIVNNDLILESDVDAEQRFAAFQPFTVPQPVSRDRLINRLIDRALILQQIALQPSLPVTDAEVESQLTALRKVIPRCAAYQCDTAEGWNKFVNEQGFSLEELKERWKQRIEVLRFIEERFRMGIRILPAEIDEYYTKTMLPAYLKEQAQAPPEATIADRIQEILLQQRVDALLDDWLTTLRAQGSVRLLKPGEEAP